MDYFSSTRGKGNGFYIVGVNPSTHMTLRSPHSTQQNHPTIRGQGALEYLLLIGGAVLIATIVLLVIVGSSQSTNTIISNNLSTSGVKVQNAFNTAAAGLGGGGGGPAAVCGDNIINGSEQCDGSASFAATCYSQGYSVGTLGCTASCQFDTTTACSGPGPFTITSLIPGASGSNNVTLNFNVNGASGSTGVVPGYVILFLKDNIGGNPGFCNLSAQTAINSPSQSISTFAGIADGTSTGSLATGVAVAALNSGTPGSPGSVNINLGTVFSNNGWGIPIGEYCFIIAGSDGALGLSGNYGVPATSGLVTFPMP